jgi:hypothetical protein
MSIEPEEFHAPRTTGTAVVTRIYRAASGQWSAEFDLNFVIRVDRHRDVLVRRYIRVGANGQRGRKAPKRKQRPTRRAK